MKINTLQNDQDGFITITMITFVTVSVICFTLWYVGAFDTVQQFFEDAFEILLDGELFGDWIAGVLIGGVVGIFQGLWNFGTSIGASTSDFL